MDDETLRYLGTALATDAMDIAGGEPVMAGLVLISTAIGLFAGIPGAGPNWPEKLGALVVDLAKAAQAEKAGGGA